MSRHARPMLARLLEKVEVAETGCWLWTATISIHGYGRFYEGGSYGRTLMAHRAAYELLVGAIPDGLTLDHLCRVRHCVNPAHLEPVTMKENLMRGDTPAAINAAKTHCHRGHAFTSDNIYWTNDGRSCKTCVSERARTRYLKRRQAQAAAA